ncbi:hypothetical protein V9T40_014115 [Parthenolecanium corni]|uniref:Uncharacterized protein n=1 Tax=Parthenolecanium corni TaxID=536013 RepID=A0AAN9Y217_9HEMI
MRFLLNIAKENFTYTLSEGARLHFKTNSITDCLTLIAGNLYLVNSHVDMTGKSIEVTGGGAYKYTDLIKEKLGLSVDKEDEMACLIKGYNFLLKHQR